MMEKASTYVSMIFSAQRSGSREDWETKIRNIINDARKEALNEARNQIDIDGNPLSALRKINNLIDNLK